MGRSEQRQGFGHALNLVESILGKNKGKFTYKQRADFVSKLLKSERMSFEPHQAAVMRLKNAEEARKEEQAAAAAAVKRQEAIAEKEVQEALAASGLSPDQLIALMMKMNGGK